MFDVIQKRAAYDEDFIPHDKAQGGKVGGNASRYFAEAQRPEGICDNIPGVRWQPSANPRFYCTRQAHHGDGKVAEVFFYFNIGEIRRAAPTAGVTVTALPLAVMTEAMGGCDIAWLEATDALRSLRGASPNGFMPLDSHFIRLSVPAGIAAERGLRPPKSGWHDYPQASVIAEIAASGHSAARTGMNVPSAATTVIAPIPSPQDIRMPDPGDFAQWLSGQDQPDDDLQAHIADAYYRIYLPLHRDGPIRDDDIDALIDVLAKDSEHTVLVQDAYNAGINTGGQPDKLVGELVDYASRIRESPRQGNIRNFIIYLMVRAGASVAHYDVPIHTNRDKPFHIEPLYAPVRGGIPQLPTEAQTWFRLHVHRTPATQSLYNLHDDQSYTISWFVEYRDADTDRVDVLPARVEGAPGFDYYRYQDHGDIHNPFFSRHRIDGARTGNYKIIASVAWFERLHAQGKAGPTRRHVHFVEQDCIATPVCDRMRTAALEAPKNAFGRITAGYYTQAAYIQAMPPDIAYDLYTKVIAPPVTAAESDDKDTQDLQASDIFADLTAHVITIDAPGIRQVGDGRSFTATFGLAAIDADTATNSDTGSVRAQWYVAATTAEYIYWGGGPVVRGADIDPRVVADISFIRGGEGDSLSFATMTAGDYAIVAIPSDGTRPVMYPLRVFHEDDREAQLALAYHEHAAKLHGYADAGVAASDYADPTPFVVNPTTDTRFIPLAAAHMSDKTGAITPLHLYLATTDPAVDWNRLATGDVSGHSGFRIIDAGLGKPQSVYDGGTIDHCITRFERENAYPKGWVELVFDPSAVDPESRAAPLHFGPFETNGQSDMQWWSGRLGGGSLGLSLTGMGLALTGSAIFAPIGVMCLVVGQLAAIASTVASLQANQLQDEVDKKLIWVDVAGLATCLVGLAGLGRLVVGTRGAIAAAGGTQRTAIHIAQLGRTQVTLGLADTVMSGAEVLLMSSHAYDEIDKILGRSDLDRDQKIMATVAALTNVVIGGALWALGARGDIIGNKTRDADPLIDTHKRSRPAEEGGRPRGPIALDPHLENRLSGFVDPAIIAKLKALKLSGDTRAADNLLRKLDAEIEHHGGWDQISADKNRQRKIDDWLTARLAPVANVNETAIMTRLFDSLSGETCREVAALLKHYRALPDAAQPEGYAKRFLADISKELSENGVAGCTSRVYALTLVEFGATPLRIRYFLAPVFEHYPNRDFAKSKSQYQRLQRHFVDRGYQSRIPDAVVDQIKAAYQAQRRRALRRLETQLLRNAADDNGNRLLTESTHARLLALVTYYQRSDGNLDLHYQTMLTTVWSKVATDQPKLANLLVLAEYMAAFGYSDQLAREILSLGLDYHLIRQQLFDLRFKGPVLRRFDAIQRQRSGEPTSNEFPARERPQVDLTGPNPPLEGVYATLLGDLRWLVQSQPNRAIVILALEELKSDKYSRLLVGVARSSDSMKRTFFALLRVCYIFNDISLTARATAKLLRHQYDDVLSTGARQSAYDTQAARFRNAHPGAPQHGHAAANLPPLRGREFDECIDLLEGRGFRLVSQWPSQGSDPTTAIWFHSGDGSVVRFRTRYTDNGTQTTATKSVMALDDTGQLLVPGQPGARELYRVADATTTNEDFDMSGLGGGDNQTGGHARLAANPDDVAADTRARLAQQLPDDGGRVTQHDIDEVTGLWSSVTEVPIVRGGRNLVEPSADSRPKDTTRGEDSQSDGPETGKARGGASNEPTVDEQLDNLISVRDLEGVSTSESDRRALRRLLERSATADRVFYKDIWIHCTGLHVLVELEVGGERELLNYLRIAAIDRLKFDVFHDSDNNLATLLRIVRMLGPGRRTVQVSALRFVGDWRQFESMLRADATMARAILELVNRLPSGQYYDATLYQRVYERVGEDVFLRHTDAPDATLVLTAGQDDQILRGSVEKYNDDLLVNENGAQQVRPEHEGGLTQPWITSDKNLDDMRAFKAAGDELGRHGFDVVLLDAINPDDLTPPKPLRDPPSLIGLRDDEVAPLLAQYHDEMLENGRTKARHQDALARQSSREALVKESGLRPRSAPTYLVNDRVTSVYNVLSTDALNDLSSDLSLSAAQGYSRNAVVYLNQGSVTPEQVLRHLQDNPPLLVENCLVVDAAGVHRVWPRATDTPETLPLPD